MIEILSAAPLMTVQDMGRSGNYRYGVCRSGAMDRVALAIGNALLGNDENAAALEIPMPPVRIFFRSEINFALTGADCVATLDGSPIPPWWAMRARAGQVLSLAPPQTGSCAYLCLEGGINVPEVLGSRSTQLREGFGGLNGKPVSPGDRLDAVGNDVILPPGGLGAVPPRNALALSDWPGITLRVIPAAEYDNYTAASRDAFWSADWLITPQSNRAGYRLSGPDLTLTHPLELRSHGIVPGVIQVPPGGQPIIQLADAGTMGGYPKIGTVIEADLWRIGQARAGDRLRFIETDYGTAIDALEAVKQYLYDMRRQTALLRKAARRWEQV